MIPFKGKTTNRVSICSDTRDNHPTVPVHQVFQTQALDLQQIHLLAWDHIVNRKLPQLHTLQARFLVQCLMGTIPFILNHIRPRIHIHGSVSVLVCCTGPMEAQHTFVHTLRSLQALHIMRRLIPHTCIPPLCHFRGHPPVFKRHQHPGLLSWLQKTPDRLGQVRVKLLQALDPRLIQLP